MTFHEDASVTHRDRGAMAEQVRVFDWGSTPLGPAEAWPQSLKTAVDVVLGSGHGMCLVWGAEQTFLYNDAYAPMLGVRHPGALGTTFEAAWPDVWSDIEPLVRRVFAGETVTFENMPLVMTRKGYPEDTWWTFSYSPVRDESGVVAGLLNVTVETTRRVLVERQRDAAETSLRELAETLEQRVEARSQELAATEDRMRQMQKMEAIGQLTGGVAHDFNNLLTIIRSSADLLRRQELAPERRQRYIDAISDTADRAAKLTGQLLAFARRQALRLEVFDAAGRVATIADMLRTVVGARVQLTVEAACSPCYVEADATQFETALINMAVNARDAMDGEGQLTILVDEATNVPALRGHASAPGDFVVVSVRDTGVGMGPEQLGRIFEPFFTTKEVGKGTGLGLSQVYGFAKQSGGEVDVASWVGSGATFRLYLPRTSAPTEPSEPVAAAPEIRNDGCILVVEDNEQVGEFATQLLRDLGYSTRYAGNARDAWTLLDAEHASIDVVFSDVVMPGESGVELARRIQARWPKLTVVLTSGYSHVLADDARHGFDLLHKPYSVEELSAVLQRARRSKG